MDRFNIFFKSLALLIVTIISTSCSQGEEEIFKGLNKEVSIIREFLIKNDIEWRGDSTHLLIYIPKGDSTVYTNKKEGFPIDSLIRSTIEKNRIVYLFPEASLSPTDYSKIYQIYHWIIRVKKEQRDERAYELFGHPFEMLNSPEKRKIRINSIPVYLVELEDPGSPVFEQLYVNDSLRSKGLYLDF